MQMMNKLKLLSAWETEPVLTETELEEILDSAAVPDTDGNSPTNDNWVPTYDINKAAGEAWLVKAGKVSALVEIDFPDSGLFTSQVFENCMAMSRRFSPRVALTITTRRIRT